ncbi:hypothetical protein F3Y22_tig00117048pilonHSYRG00607 [Hibiscus syriacus]|uniref:Uncharacterized protein n=1 Tax=Hibiscus syriacus TaxID=106335 RepID=A0A6A2X7Z6_HIBSY|nr:hypothetical protein F3Y22_tig00117048pilonHSYRG00607 [Hibiscus syriacus]
MTVVCRRRRRAKKTPLEAFPPPQHEFDVGFSIWGLDRSRSKEKAGVWRIKALEESGWPERTTVEDMDIAVREHLNGWKFIYLNDVKEAATSLAFRTYAPLPLMPSGDHNFQGNLSSPSTPSPVFMSFLNILPALKSFPFIVPYLLFENTMSVTKFNAIVSGLFKLGSSYEWVVTKKAGSFGSEPVSSTGSTFLLPPLPGCVFSPSWSRSNREADELKPSEAREKTEGDKTKYSLCPPTKSWFPAVQFSANG